TPDFGYISHHFSNSLDGMAHASNPLIGPAILGCTSSNPNCLYSEFMPENLNILPINFYNDLDYNLYQIFTASNADDCNNGLNTCPLTPERRATLECGGRVGVGNYIPGSCGVDACFVPALIRSGDIQCTYYDPVHFDYVEEVLRFDEYARTAPV